MKIPSYAKASEGYPPVAKSAEAVQHIDIDDSNTTYAFIHGQSPRSSAKADKGIYVTGMKQIITISIALLMIPFTAFSLDLMRDSEMDSVTGMAVVSAIGELNTDQTIGSSIQGSVVVATESNAGQESKSLVRGMTVKHGVEIYVYDVSFDIHIQNMSGGGALVAEDILLF